MQLLVAIVYLVANAISSNAINSPATTIFTQEMGS
jgi:uncharacterized membrane protein